jgi:hypothetical protein
MRRPVAPEIVRGRFGAREQVRTPVGPEARGSVERRVRLVCKSTPLIRLVVCRACLHPLLRPVCTCPEFASCLLG